MADLEVVWKGITLGGQGSYVISEMTGWDEMPGLNDLSAPRVRGHGEHLGDQFSQARTVTVAGTIVDDSGLRDVLATALQDAAIVTSDLDTLTVTVFGRRLTAAARVIRRTVSAGATYGVGAVPFALQFKCPDPLRYDAAQPPVSAVLPVSSGGMAFPMAFPMDFGSSGALGQITLFNNGTAPAPIFLTVTGSLPSGFEVSTTDGQRLRYEFPVASGETLTLDTGEGTLVTGGGADRRPYLTWADWIQVQPASSVTLQFSSLGGTADPAATLTVPAFRSAWW